MIVTLLTSYSISPYKCTREILSVPWKIIVTVNILYPPSVETDGTIVLLSGIQQPWDRCSCARYTFTLTF